MTVSPGIPCKTVREDRGCNCLICAAHAAEYCGAQPVWPSETTAAWKAVPCTRRQRARLDDVTKFAAQLGGGGHRSSMILASADRGGAYALDGRNAGLHGRGRWLISMGRQRARLEDLS